MLISQSCEQLKQDNSEAVHTTSQSGHRALPILRGDVAESANQLGHNGCFVGKDQSLIAQNLQDEL
ncbi:hypothetical protein PAHAL_4G319200 [Panicum hallii]|jgi:hypothetical protein|uniref:Uncharacterized protein n=1 Tax=Panicum hallii TaxID=206008 RepID=A0A2T8JEQ8_9POAL|nr:hypothetical protein PAHAL_4G319200 [Panicum hallii]